MREGIRRREPRHRPPTGAASEESSAIDERLGIAALGAVALLSFFACARHIWSADFWWQYATGRHVAEHGWPTVDTLSFTAAGAPWIELRWLFCWAQFRIYETFGPFGAAALIVLKWLTVAAAFSFVAAAVLRRGTRVLTAVVLLIALLAASQRFFVRPEIVTYLLFGVFAFVLDRDRRRPSPALWALPALQLLWVNTHPLFFYGPALIVLMLLVRAVAHRAAGVKALVQLAPIRRLLLALGLSVVACMVNPYGLQGLKLPWTLFTTMRGSVFRDAISELHGPLSFGLGTVAVQWWLVLVAACVLAAVVAGRRIDPFWGLLCASQLALSALSIRNLALFSLAAVPFVVSSVERSRLAERLRPETRRRAAQLAAVSTIAIALLYGREMATDRISLRQNDTNQFGFGLAEHRFPERAVAYLDAHGLEGHAFSTLLEGAYLEAHGRLAYADPRLEVYGPARFERFLAALASHEAFDREVREWDLRLAVVDSRAPVVRRLSAHPRFRLLQFDEVASVWARDDAVGALDPIDQPAEFGLAARYARESLGPPRGPAAAGPFGRVALPGPYLALADFLLMNGQAAPARPLLEDVAALSPELPGLAARRVTLAELEGDARGLVVAAREALAESPSDAAMMVKLGEGHYRLSEWREARDWLTRSLDALPDRGATWSALGRIAVQEQNLDEAARCFTRAIQAEPAIAVHRSNLARVLALQGRTADAIAGLRAANELDPRNPAVLRDLATLLLRAGDVEGARAQARRGLLLAPDDPELRRLAAGS